MGTFNTKSVLKYSEQDYGKPIRNLVQLSEPLIVCKDTSMLQMLMIFQEKRKTMAFISDNLLAKGGEDVKDVVQANPSIGQSTRHEPASQ
jgi:CBS domain containing-hemolysin-like protein